MKNSIQFKHFRKFEEFPKLDFNDITFVVGKNNSGKSTFVKAFVMVYNYLNSGNLKTLDLNQNSVELLNIVTFDRALCKTMSDRIHKDHISITVKVGDYEFFLDVTGKPDSTLLDVIEFKVIDYISNFTLTINPIHEQITIFYSSKALKENDALKNAIAELDEVKNDLDKLEDELSKESIELKMHFEKLNKIIDSFENTKVDVQTSFTVNEFYSAKTFPELFEDLFPSLEKKYFIQNPNFQRVEKEVVEEDISKNESESLDYNANELDNVEGTYENEFDDLRYYYMNRHNFEKFFKQFISFVNLSQIFYLPATLNKQSALLSIRDKNNDLADVVHKYHQLSLEKDPIISGFVKHWLKEFQIGTDISIKLVNGEAYSIDLIENSTLIPLADKGMGSIQAVLLILRLASVIYLKQQVAKKSIFEYFIIIEEPELNLHPALQSTLCHLFFAVHEKYKIKFIIETHSEYVIRKSQSVVKEKELEIEPNENPFSVIYFNDDLKVWNMIYRKDGRFSNEFGSGFFDESSNLAFELL